MVQVELAQLRYRLPRLRGRGHAAQPAGRGHRHPRVRARPSSRSTAGASCAASQKLERDLDGLGATARDAAQGAAPARRPARSRSSATRTRASRRCSTGSPHAGVLVENQLFSTLDPDDAPAAPARRRDGAALRHGRVRAPPAAPARRGVPLDARRGRRRRPAGARRRRERARRRRRGSPRSTPCCARSTPATCPRCSCGTRPTSPTPTTSKRSARARTRARSRSRPRPATGIDRAARARSATGCARSRRIVEFVVPYDRGDVLAALHRAGEVLVEVHDDDGTRVRGPPPRRVRPGISPSSRERDAG